MSSVFAVFTRSFAPYRFHFYEELRQGAFRDTSLILVEEAPRDHPWRQGPDQIFGGPMKVTGMGLKGLARIWKELEAADPALLMVTESSPYAALAMVWAKLNGVPFLLATEAGRNSPSYALKWYSGLWHGLWRRAARGILACTAEARRTAEEMGKPVFLAPHAVHAAHYTPAEKKGLKGPVKFLFVGGLIERKGVRELVEAGKILEKRGGPDFRIRLMGTGPLLGEVQKAAENCLWLEIGGFAEGDALVKEYQDADVFVLPTHEDTYAVVVHEAACCGLALVISEAAGAREVLVDGIGSGLTVPPRSPEALAEAMQKMREDPEFRSECGVRAREVGEKYSVDRQARGCGIWMRQVMENQDCR